MITTLDKVKLLLGITTNTQDDLINALIPVVEDDFLFIRNKEFDVAEDGITKIYPTGSEMTAIRMIAYLLSQKENSNMGEAVQSESISRYSVTYSDKSSNFGYPKSLTNMIERFVRFY